MMYHQDTEKTTLPGFRKHLAQGFDLLAAEPSGSHANGRRARRGNADDRRIAPHSYEGKGRGRGTGATRQAHVAAVVFRPTADTFFPDLGDIGVVIAGDERYPIRPTQLREPFDSIAIFRGERDVNQITGQRYMVGAMGFDVIQHGLQGEHTVNLAAIEMPRQKPARALAEELCQPRGGKGPQMRIGQVRKLEHAGGAARLTVEDSSAIEARSLRVTVVKVQAS